MSATKVIAVNAECSNEIPHYSCECNIAVAVGIAVISPAQSEDNIGVMLFAEVLHCLNTIQTLNGLPNAADRQR